MGAIEALQKVELQPRHLDDACALVAEAGWNETRDDWLMMMQAGHAFGFEDDGERLVASALTMPYGDVFGWISMVLVTAAWRRKGLATGLLDRCIADHAAAGRVSVLDATPDGEPVYRRLGFRNGITIQRWQGVAGTGDRDGRSPIRRFDDADIAAALDYDQAVFGGDRGAVLRDIATRPGARGWHVSGSNGFLLSRSGRIARQLGPLCADTETDAVALVTTALAELEGPVFIDVPDCHSPLTDALVARGFTSQRPFRRMYQGKPGPFDEVTHLFALAGPEIG